MEEDEKERLYRKKEANRENSFVALRPAGQKECQGMKEWQVDERLCPCSVTLWVLVH